MRVVRRLQRLDRRRLPGEGALEGCRRRLGGRHLRLQIGQLQLRERELVAGFLQGHFFVDERSDEIAFREGMSRRRRLISACGAAAAPDAPTSCNALTSAVTSPVPEMFSARVMTSSKLLAILYLGYVAVMS